MRRALADPGMLAGWVEGRDYVVSERVPFIAGHDARYPLTWPRIVVLCGQGLGEGHHMSKLAETVITRITADLAASGLDQNKDGGAGAIEFIRGFAARSARTPAQAEADRSARWAEVLRSIR